MSEYQENDYGWWLRFSIGAAIAALANFVQLLLTLNVRHSDGFAQFGWPFVIYEYGGFSGGEEHFYPWELVINLAILIVFAVVYAELTRHGFVELIRRLRTWGTPREIE